MTVKDKIVEYLSSNGRSTVAEIAQGIDYSHGYVCRNAKDLRSDGKIKGAKGKQIPAVIVDRQYYVLTGNRSYLMKIVRKHAPSKTPKAKGISISKLQKLICKEIADSVVGGPRRWNFWL